MSNRPAICHERHFNVNNRNVVTIEGIHFPLARTIDLNFNALEVVDLISAECDYLHAFLAAHNRIHTFIPVESLQTLILSHNCLRTIDLSGLINLRRLLLHHNQLYSINLAGLKNLEELDLSHNKLQEVNLLGMLYLHSLSLHDNQLTTFNGNELESLYSLNLSNNRLTKLEIEELYYLKFVNLSHNRLTTLKLRRPNFSQLMTTHNQLISVDIRQVDILRLSYNELTSFKIQTIVGSLSLNHNRLRCLEIADVTDLNLRGNPVLHKIRIGKVKTLLTNGISQFIGMDIRQINHQFYQRYFLRLVKHVAVNNIPLDRDTTSVVASYFNHLE